VQPSRLHLRVRKNGFELSDSLFSTGSRISTEFSIGPPVQTGSNCLRKQPNGFDFMVKLRKKPILVNFFRKCLTSGGGGGLYPIRVLGSKPHSLDRSSRS
jgi:hypothetical protein